jgi:hypothetical protein
MDLFAAQQFSSFLQFRDERSARMYADHEWTLGCMCAVTASVETNPGATSGKIPSCGFSTCLIV